MHPVVYIKKMLLCELVTTTFHKTLHIEVHENLFSHSLVMSWTDGRTDLMVLCSNANMPENNEISVAST
jgi:hypothetical protein